MTRALALKALEQAFVRRTRELRASVWELAESVNYDPYVLARSIDKLDWKGREGMFLDAYKENAYKVYREVFDDRALKLTLDNIYGDKNPFALAFVEQRGGELIRYIDADTRSLINRSISNAIESNLNYKTAAREIADLVDLLPAHVDAVQRRRSKLLASGMSKSRVSQETTKYANKLRDYRAKNIASYELSLAKENATLDTWLYAQSQGKLSSITKKVWVPSGSGPCPNCVYLASLPPILINQYWTTPKGDTVKTPPLHGHCGCTQKLVTS